MVSPRSKSKYRKKSVKQAGKNIHANILKCKASGSQAGGFYMDGSKMIILGDRVFHRFMERYGHHLREDPEFHMGHEGQVELPPCPNIDRLGIDEARRHLTACLTAIQGNRPIYDPNHKPSWWHLQRYTSVNKGGFKKAEVLQLIANCYQHYGIQLNRGHSSEAANGTEDEDDDLENNDELEDQDIMDEFESMTHEASVENNETMAEEFTAEAQGVAERVEERPELFQGSRNNETHDGFHVLQAAEPVHNSLI